MAATAEVIDLAERLPTVEEMESAAEAASALARARNENGSLTIPIAGEGEVRLAPAIAEVIIELLGVLARNNMVTIVPTGAELTTQQAADMLNVSRPYISKLIKEGKLEHVRVGSHRRVPLDALMAYKARRDAGRTLALRELARLGQEYDAAASR
jgi:excisionase family DNA binding protein